VVELAAPSRTHPVDDGEDIHAEVDPENRSGSVLSCCPFRRVGLHFLLAVEINYPVVIVV